jgi:creatinine amidohydrolase
LPVGKSRLTGRIDRDKLTATPTSGETPMRGWKLAELNYAHVKTRDYQVAVIPIGCTEPHNLHLPYGMDNIEVETMGDLTCAAAHERGAKVVLLPAIPYGTVSNQSACPLSINVNPSTLYALVTDLVASLVNHGIHKIVLLNGHGGNEFKPLLRELYGTTDARLFVCNWYEMVNDVRPEIFEHPDDHAGEMETSIALAYCPDLVGRNADGTLIADDGATAETRFEAVNRGWVSITRPWHLFTTNAGSGYPHAATAEKGQRLMEIIVERLAGFLVELSDAELDERFPF